jgi:hypothetical protein
MNWYAAHLVEYLRLHEKEQKDFFVFENVVLVQASTTEEAFAKAEAYGRDYVSDAPCWWRGKPATMVFGGVRKLTTCLDSEQRPKDGTEVTYLNLLVTGKSNFQRYLGNEPAVVTVQDGPPHTPKKSGASRNGKAPNVNGARSRTRAKRTFR